MSQFIVHMGMPRTGTTSLQRALYEDHRLWDWGVYYPRHVYTLYKPSHGWLSKALYDKSFRSLRQQLGWLSHQAEGRIVLLSDEGLFFVWHLLSMDAKEWLAEYLNQGSSGFVVTWRDPEDVAMSLFCACQNWPMPTLPGFPSIKDYALFKDSDFIQALLDLEGKNSEFHNLFERGTYFDYSEKIVPDFYLGTLRLPPPAEVPWLNSHNASTQ